MQTNLRKEGRGGAIRAMRWPRRRAIVHLCRTAIRRSPCMRQAGAALAIFALLMQVWIPWVHHPAIAVTTNQEIFGGPSSIPAFAFPLCLAGGPTDPDQSGLPDKQPTRKPGPCPICQTLQLLGHAIAPQSDFAILSPPPAALQVPLVAAAFVARPLQTSSQPRAPPLTA